MLASSNKLTNRVILLETIMPNDRRLTFYVNVKSDGQNKRKQIV